MNARDVAMAQEATGTNTYALCNAIDTILPVLHYLRDRTSSLKFWVKLGLSIAIGALEGYRRGVCSTE